ncbi:MAG: hypothetical protein LQ350_001737 [Teloschistes chrysophthalmus]|nr:MAG: hypothetical protein LQ350_001737 [Niorma chrysophthalma]
MASHSLVIAKASLVASLMRPEPHSILRAEIAHFQRILEALALQCSTTNIQLCKDWLLKNTAPSPAKTSAVGKFLVALASSFSTSDATGDDGHVNKSKPSSRRQQLHILYLVHDLLHHAKFHATNLADSDSPNQGLRPYISQLVSVASAYDAKKYPQHFIKINELLNLWNKGKYFPASYLASLKEASTSTSKATTSLTGNIDDGEGSNAKIEPAESRKDAPYIMPASHGDASDPYYDLPAGNLMPHIVPNSSMPIAPRTVKPLQFRAGPANEKLANTVKAFLQEADAVYGVRLPGNGVLGTDIDQLGQSVTFNGSRGEPLIILTSGYGRIAASCGGIRNKLGVMAASQRTLAGNTITASIASARLPGSRPNSNPSAPAAQLHWALGMSIQFIICLLSDGAQRRL